MRPDNTTDGSERDIPFIDTSGEDPKVAKDRDTGCFGSSKTGGECSRMELSFENIDEWDEHRDRHHPVGCGETGCNILSAYKKDNSPTSYCYKHIPDNPETVYAWKRTNTKSVVEPPKADSDHLIESALPDRPLHTGVDRNE